MKKLSLRLMLFNILLLFLPMGSMLYLDTYEKQLLKFQENSMIQQARIFSSALEGRDLAAESEQIILRLSGRVDSRIRIVDPAGRLLADSAVIIHETTAEPPPSETIPEKYAAGGTAEDRELPAQETLLYRMAVYPLKALRKLLIPPAVPMESSEYYSGKEHLDGREISAALDGRYGASVRISSGGQRSVTLYSAIPVNNEDGGVIGAVLVSKSTYQILRYLYEFRLDIVKIFLISLLVSVVLSFGLSMNITIPISRLNADAGQILDQSGNIRRHFTGFRRGDEIGELSRSLSSLSLNLERRMNFIDGFTADLLHELKNPLSAIRGAAELAADSGRYEPELIAGILREERRMERLLSQLREMSSLDNAIEREQREFIDLCVLVPVVLSRYTACTGVRVVFTPSVHACHAAVNPDRFVQLLVNPVDNAVSFSPEDGEVRISCSAESGKAVITVEDDGPGIPDEVGARVFERFYSDRTEEDSREHSGLGLSITKSIAEAYGGGCFIENRSEGGCRLTVELPCVQQ